MSFPIIENQPARRKLVHDDETIKNNNARETPARKDQNKDGYEFDVGHLPAWAKKQVEICDTQDGILRNHDAVCANCSVT